MWSYNLLMYKKFIPVIALIINVPQHTMPELLHHLYNFDRHFVSVSDHI